MHIGQLQQSTSRRRELSLTIVWVWQKKKSLRLELSTSDRLSITNSWVRKAFTILYQCRTFKQEEEALRFHRLEKLGSGCLYLVSLQDWLTDLLTAQTTPQQENGFDCGVFTCQFLETLSRGEEYFKFSQKNMPYLRRRMIWEIGNATLRDDHY